MRTYLRPAVTGFPTFRNEEWLRRRVRYNREGYRDRDHALVPGSTRRVLVIGDSFAMGWGIDDTEDRFSEQLARELARHTGAPWEPVTVASGDRHTLEELEMLPTGLKYCPDLVVLLYVFNDMDYLAPITVRRPMLEGQGVLGKLNPVRLAFTNSYLLQELIFLTFRAIRPLRRAEVAGFGIYEDSSLVATHQEDLRRFVDRAGAGGSGVAIVPFDVILVDDPRAAQRYQSFVRRGLAAGLPMVPIDGVFAGHRFDSLTVNWRDRHPNELAHRLAAAGAAPGLLQYVPPERPACFH